MYVEHDQRLCGASRCMLLPRSHNRGSMSWQYVVALATIFCGTQVHFACATQKILIKNQALMSYIVVHEISHNSTITLLCAAKVAYLEQTALNNY